jgi:hypothetical protein
MLIIIIAAVLVVAAAITLTVVLVNNNKSAEKGWQKITATGVDESLSKLFIFEYDVTDETDIDKLSRAYGDALKRAYAIFSPEAQSDDSSDAAIVGLGALNLSAGVPISVSEELYNALELVKADSTRSVFLGPIYERYRHVFSAISPSAAVSIDPTKNEYEARVCESIASLASDGNNIYYDLTQNNTVVLYVSAEYQELLDTIGTHNYLDFGWMRDAFIVDSIANSLTFDGYTNGTIASYSGFTRNLDTDEEEYTFGLYDLFRGSVYLASSVSYKGAISTVTYKTFAMNNIDKQFLCEYSNGDVTHGYIDRTTGQPINASDMMVFHSKTKSCAEIAVETAHCFITAEENKSDIKALLAVGIGAIWCDGTLINYTSDDVTIFDLFSSDSLNIHYSTTK